MVEKRSLTRWARVIRRHRELAGLPPVPEEAIAKVKGVGDVPDLFLPARREFPVSPKHHHVLVEIKAPKVSLGRPELEQLDRYAQTLLESSEFDKENARWDVFLVSTQPTTAIEWKRKESGRPYRCVGQWPNKTLWVYTWGELIDQAKDELHLVREHLEMKSVELSVSEDLAQEYPKILSAIKGGYARNSSSRLDTHADWPATSGRPARTIRCAW